MQLIDPPFLVNGLMSNQVQNLIYHESRDWNALVVGRAGLDLYPQPPGSKTTSAELFASDVGGSGANIAIAMKRAGGNISLISALSNDPVGLFVKNRLVKEGIEIDLMQTTHGNERTSLAIAEERPIDCEVVIYRNNPADLQIIFDQNVKLAILNSSNLVVTGTSLISDHSRKQVLKMMKHAKNNDCKVWLDLDYRHWNWPDEETTRSAYQKAEELSDVIIGNEEEFKILNNKLTIQVQKCISSNQIMILKQGQNGCTLFSGDRHLDAGIYKLKALKPYGSGDAFLGNLIMNYMSLGDWEKAIDAGSAAAAIVVSKQGCASAMPTAKEIKSLQDAMTIEPKTEWS
jgi:5-dehydro-2-deoxygluconokinase